MRVCNSYMEIGVLETAIIKELGISVPPAKKATAAAATNPPPPPPPPPPHATTATNTTIVTITLNLF